MVDNYHTSAFELFCELENSVAETNIRKVYSAYQKVFTQAINQKLQDVNLQFASGLASKTDYLLKEYNADAQLRKNVQNTRSRLRFLHSTPEKMLLDRRYADLTNICQFIEAIYAVRAPQSLQRLFVKQTPNKPNQSLAFDALRVSVVAWDEEKIIASSPDVDGDILVPFKSNLGYTVRDYTYLRKTIFVGEQLNLCRPRIVDNQYMAELIIALPDYLVDVSAVAACFETYTDSAAVHLIKKLKPNNSTQATLIGNFASQLLDESIHNRDLPYSQSLNTFFRQNILQLITCDDLDTTFHQLSKLQKQNIESAISRLIDYDKSFCRSNAIIEPSFFCEMLGLQGRMDMLQLDYNLLIEQKSGKSEWPEPTHSTEVPHHKENHYVQLLLYMAILHYAYSKPNDDIYAFLLYSKYDAGLIKEGPAPELLYKAINIRNMIAISNYLFTKADKLQHTLLSLTPDSLNSKALRGSLWENYVKPDLQALLNPIHEASQLEQAYYFRFFKFLQTEQLHAKMGVNGRNDAGQAAIWNVSLDEKKQAGNIYDNLHLQTPQIGENGISTIVLFYDNDIANDMANFRHGDIVILYAYKKDEEPDACSTMVFRATIADILIDHITLALRFPQSDTNVFKRTNEYVWAIEHDYMESSYSSLYRGLHSFLSAPQQRKDLILLRREPIVDTERRLIGDYGQFNDLVLRVQQAQDMFLVIGPPGTGKTSFGLVNILQEALLHQSSVILMSYTNRAVDEICSKLEGQKLDYIRVGSRVNCPQAYQHRLLDNVAAQLHTLQEIKQHVIHTSIWVGTTTAFNANLQLFALKQFDLAIIDEASQILEPHLIGLLTNHHGGALAIKKFVLIGDHKQLPAVVRQSKSESRVADADILRTIGLSDCANSMFERLLLKYRDRKDVVYMLTAQGRMHPEISLFPNYEFYQNKLLAVPLEHQKKVYPALASNLKNAIEQMLTTRAMAFVAVEPNTEGQASDKINQAEADVIAAIVIAAYNLRKDNFSPQSTIGVIVPYRNQITTVRNAIDKYGVKELHDITIDTVERYQGSQRDVVIYGFTISKLYQLQFLTNNTLEEDGAVIDRKLNVALTRARENLVLVGNAKLLSENFTFFKLIEFLKSRQAYFSVPPTDFCKGLFSVPERLQMSCSESTEATCNLSPRFEQAFQSLVAEPIMQDCRTNNQYVLGNEPNTNRALIAYGRKDFSTPIAQVSDIDKLHAINDATIYSADDQVMLYAYLMMRQAYCNAKALYASRSDYLKQLSRAFPNSTYMIDFGCGPATCVLAMVDELENAVMPQYIGVDTSFAMMNLGKKFLDKYDLSQYHFAQSFSELDEQFLRTLPQMPSAYIFNFSYFFSIVDASFTESLANQLLAFINKYPQNKYVFIIQQSLADSDLQSYNAFMSVVRQSSNLLVVVEQSEIAGNTCSLPCSYSFFEIQR